MAYRARLLSTPETVQDLTLAAGRRLHEAEQLLYGAQYHGAIYLGGLSAEMHLKSAYAHLVGARPPDPIAAYLQPVCRGPARQGPFRGDYEMGHGLWFWSHILLQERQARGHSTSRQFHRTVLSTCATLYSNWFVAMRYRPGTASLDEALVFVATAEWLKANHGALFS